jgi:3-phenylpropionate/trans-cinnamate dioxygenase ferredoxin component
MASGYVKVALKADIPVGKMKLVKAGEKEVLLANVEEKYYAVGNKCTHMGGNLSLGILKGKTVACPMHKAKFDLSNGKVLSPPSILFFHPKIGDLPSYPVKEEKGNILVKV